MPLLPFFIWLVKMRLVEGLYLLFILRIVMARYLRLLVEGLSQKLVAAIGIWLLLRMLVPVVFHRVILLFEAFKLVYQYIFK